jgi:site-specific recombinase
LSTAQLALGLSALGADALLSNGAWLAMLGILVIGALNFGVSFALAMWLAIRAREVSIPEALRLLRLTSLELWRRPLAFLLPLDGDAPAALLRDGDEALAEHMARASPEHDRHEGR